jgi:hypothetical protein
MHAATHRLENSAIILLFVFTFDSFGSEHCLTPSALFSVLVLVFADDGANALDLPIEEAINRG